jgi:signal transduction histidine kinase
MVEHLTRDLGSLRHGDHLCLPYEHVDEKTEAVVPFIAEGLARGERCVYIADLDQRDALLAALSNAGVNASRALDRGSLWLRTSQETYFRSGKFDPDDMLALADELIAGAVTDGFVGVRGSGEASGAQDHGRNREIDWADLYAYEVRFNERFARRPIVALCRYHRAAAPPAHIADALRAHPTAIVSGRVCRNSYYEKPDVALAGDAERVEWMLHQLRRSSASDLRALAMTRTLAGETSRLAAENQTRAHVEEELERAIRMRDRFLDDLTRELAAPVAGLTAEIESLAGISPAYERRGQEERTASAALVRHLKRLGSVVEQLKEVARLTNRQTVIPLDSVDLVDVARQVALRNRERMAAMGSSVVLHSEPRIQGHWDRRRLEHLLTNLLLSAARLGAGQPVDLELATDGGSALISVRYQGAPRSCDDEGGVFDGGAHDDSSPAPAGEGRVGLWVAREIASAFGGSLRLPGAENNGDGTARPGAVISVDLPRSGARSRYGVPAPRPQQA